MWVFFWFISGLFLSLSLCVSEVNPKTPFRNLNRALERDWGGGWWCAVQKDLMEANQGRRCLGSRGEGGREQTLLFEEGLVEEM